MRKGNYTIEDRLARSERAKQMAQEIVVDPETGLERRKFGGPQPRSGRPRKPRAGELIAEKIAAEADEYFIRLDGIAKNGKDALAIAAIRELLGIEEKERIIADQQNERLEKLQRDDLIYLALDLIKKTGIVGNGFDIEGEVEEVEDGRYPELSP